ncbi:MAG TPA: CRTAC1 family protein [Bauldia sp.]|nr:CRTAC1 family protein [Bauldia sp.]
MRTLDLRILIAALAVTATAEHATAADAPAVPSFVEETASSGINSIYAGEWQYMVGGGVATFDCNGDGFPDMLLAGGEKPATFYRNASAKGGALKFVAEQSGLELDAVTGAYPIDIDSDGIMDVVLLRVGQSVVMRGLGGCKFERANDKWAFDGGDAWATAFAAEWEHGAKWPTLAIGTYIDRTKDIEPWGSCTDNWLLRPNADAAGFGPRIPLTPSFCTLSMLFTDWNRSGTASLRVSNDREYYLGGTEQMWKVDPGQPPALYTAKDGWKPLKIWGMGIASADINGDGYPDYFLTSMADNKLQTFTTAPATGTPVKPDFKDIALSKNVIAQRPYTGGDVRPSTAWHAQFEDVNNDGLLDLFVAKGNVSKMPDFAQNDPNNLLIQTADGKFVEVGDKAGVASMQTSRGGAVVDLNLDGLLDIVVVNRWTTAQVWRNTSTNAGHWLQVKLSEPAPNVDAVGAWVEVRCNGSVLQREITSGGGHVSGEAGWWHFGIGNETAAEVRVTWPDGTQSDWGRVDADKFYVVARDKPPVAWDAN